MSASRQTHLDPGDDQGEVQKHSSQAVLSTDSWVGAILAVAGAALIVVGVCLPAITHPSDDKAGVLHTLIENDASTWLALAALITVSTLITVEMQRFADFVAFLGLCGILYAVYASTGDRAILETFGGATTGLGSMGPHAVVAGSALAFVGGLILISAGPKLVEPDKPCPDCAEYVPAAANVCRHCGYRFAPISSRDRSL